MCLACAFAQIQNNTEELGNTPTLFSCDYHVYHVITMCISCVYHVYFM